MKSKFGRNCATVLAATITTGLALLPSPASAVSLLLTDDVIVAEGAPTFNFGAHTGLQVSNVSGGRRYSYLKFDAANSLPVGTQASDISQAYLILYVNTVTTAGKFNVHKITSNNLWIPVVGTTGTIEGKGTGTATSTGTITWNNPAAGNVTVASQITPVGQSYTMDYQGPVQEYIAIEVTDIVRDWISSPSTNYGLALKPNGSDAVNLVFDSKENSTNAHGPRIEVVLKDSNVNLAAVASGTWTGASSIDTVGTITTGTWNGGTISIGSGGTGSTTPAGARANLGLGIGVDVQAWNANLDDLADGSLSGGKISAGIAAGNITVGNLAVQNGGTGSSDGSITGTGSLTFTAGGSSGNVNLTPGGGGVVTVGGALIVNGLKVFGDGAVGNTMLGAQVLQNNSGQRNTGVGYQALAANTSGVNNTAQGYQAMSVGTVASRNAAFGAFALAQTTTGASNTAVGTQALSVNTTGAFNVALGDTALGNLISGANNVAIGYIAGSRAADGSLLTSATRGVYIGSGAAGLSNSDVNSIVIGANAAGEGANTTVIGNANTLNTHLFGTLTLSGKRILGIADPTGPQDAATKAYVDAHSGAGGGATGTVTSVNITGGPTGLSFSGGPITSSGSIDLGGTLSIGNGGTGATSATAARSNLGLAIGVDVQPWNANLDAWATKTVPSGAVVGASDTQNLTNKTINGLRFEGTQGTLFTFPSTGGPVATLNRNNIFAGNVEINGSGNPLTVLGAGPSGLMNLYVGNSWLYQIISDIPGNRFGMLYSDAGSWSVDNVAGAQESYLYLDSGTFTIQAGSVDIHGQEGTPAKITLQGVAPQVPNAVPHTTSFEPQVQLVDISYKLPATPPSADGQVLSSLIDGTMSWATVAGTSPVVNELSNGTWPGASSITTVGTISAGTWNGTSISLSKGGTGATDAVGARASLGLVIGTDVQAHSVNLDTWAAKSAIQESDLSLSDNATANVSTTKHGLVPKLPGDATKFLNGAGQYTTPFSATDSGVAYIRISGADSTAEVGNSGRPFQTAQAAFDAGATSFNLGGQVDATIALPIGYSGRLKVCGAGTAPFSSSRPLTSNESRLSIQGYAVDLEVVDGLGDSFTLVVALSGSPGSSGSFGADGAGNGRGGDGTDGARVNLVVRKCYCGSIGIAGGPGGAGGQSLDDTPGNPGHDGPPGNLTFWECKINLFPGNSGYSADGSVTGNISYYTSTFQAAVNHDGSGNSYAEYAPNCYVGRVACVYLSPAKELAEGYGNGFTAGVYVSGGPLNADAAFLRGAEVLNVLPTDGAILKWHADQGNNGAWLPDPFANASQLLGKNIAAIEPADGQALVWDAGNAVWTPGTVSAGGGSLGVGLVSSRAGQAVVGSYNDTRTIDPQGGDHTTGVFVVGYGTGPGVPGGGAEVRRNALRVLDNGAVLVQPGGDIGMGQFTNGPRP